MSLCPRLDHLYIRYDLAHGLPEPPVAGDIGDHRGRQANKNDEEVADGQVHDEYVSDGAHVRVLGHDDDDEQVADDADHEDGEGEHEQAPLERVWVKVV